MGRPPPFGDYGIPDYLTSIGETATLDSFYANLRAQRKGAWNTDYTAVPIINFVRDKFGREAISLDYSDASNPDTPNIPTDPDTSGNPSSESSGGCFIGSLR